MAALVTWWLLLEVLGLVALPLTARVFSARMHHGYGFAKVVAIVVFSYIAWLLAQISGGSFHTCLIISGVFGVALSAGLAFLDRDRLSAWLRGDGWRSILIHDALWTFGFLFFAWQRSLGPEIFGAEKYMDFAFFNSLLRSDAMPPQDPWMSGEIFNYYYFGYLVFADLARLSALPTNIAYNLCVVSAGGFAFSAIAAVVWGLTRQLAFGVLGGAMSALIGNLDGFLQWWEKGTFIGFDYWRSSRIVEVILGEPGGEKTINEFPYFTTIHGDLHPHFIVLPLAVTLLALLVDPGRRPVDGKLRAADAWVFGALGFLFASCIAISTWELPVGAMMLFLLLQRDVPLRPLFSRGRLLAAAVVAGILVAGYLFYLPFYLHFAPPQGGVGVRLATTSLMQVFIVFGAFLTPVGFFLAYELASKATISDEQLQALGALAVLVVGVAWVAGNAVLPALVVVGGGALTCAYISEDREQRTAMLIVLGAALALLACELVYIKDPYGERLYRMNTVFKLYFQSWLLLCVAAPWCLFQLIRVRPVPASARAVAGGVFGALFLASCAYPIGITATRITYRPIPRTLDGTEYLEREHPDDFAAIDWLRNNVEGQPVILEATGNPYSYYARFSSNVGLPTVMGWANHEGLWRDHEVAVGKRRADVERMYKALTLEEIKSLLDLYDVEYIAVGDIEREDYPPEGLAKFATLPKAFEQGKTTIYRYEGSSG
jgi:YYY domain-containing protein